jgi:hypothetical protein
MCAAAGRIFLSPTSGARGWCEVDEHVGVMVITVIMMIMMIMMMLPMTIAGAAIPCGRRSIIWHRTLHVGQPKPPNHALRHMVSVVSAVGFGDGFARFRCFSSRFRRGFASAESDGFGEVSVGWVKPCHRRHTSSPSQAMRLWAISSRRYLLNRVRALSGLAGSSKPRRMHSAFHMSVLTAFQF